MKNVLILHSNLLFYKIPIFNKLSRYLKNNGYNIIIWYTGIQSEHDIIEFDNLGNLEMNRGNYKKIIKHIKADYIINYLNRKDPGILFYYYSIYYARLKSIPSIFAGHGINKQKDNVLSNSIFNFTHLLFDQILLYSPLEINKLWKIHRNKISIAYNTLDMEGRDEKIIKTSAEIKKELGIAQRIIVLSSGRIQERKKLDVLADIFSNELKNSTEAAWVIVGPGISSEMLEKISGIGNVYYYGPIYDISKVSEIFFISDIFCIPGALGLGIVEALYWGLPIVTLNVKHGPEFYYLHDKVNSFICSNKDELKSQLIELIKNNELRSKMSCHSKKTYKEEASLERSFAGYLDALVQSSHK
jgi:glycosyltransferase involved in cell wall biosynthesis